MKIYVADNLDGVNRAMVIAPNMKEAAKRMYTSAQRLRDYGWHYATDAERAEIMNRPHNEVLYAPIDHRPPKTYWRTARWTSRDAREARQQA